MIYTLLGRRLDINKQETQFHKRAGVGHSGGRRGRFGSLGRSYRKGITLVELFRLFLNDEDARM